jgi:XTP/dITP diphosphohydrolase
MPKLLLASTNRGKLIEIQALLSNPAISLLTPDELHLDLEVKEDGKTYAENAALKALAFAKISGLPALADDSGLEVDALHGAPGLYSARYAPGLAPSDADRRRFLLSKLAELPQPWTARFVCTVALAFPDGTVQFTQGHCEGIIIPEERGQSGFGYDPIFFIPSLARTMAELTMQEKNSLSHRARAVLAAVPIILQGLGLSHSDS